MAVISLTAVLPSLLPRPSHPSVCCLQFLALVLQVTNTGTRRPG